MWDICVATVPTTPKLTDVVEVAAVVTEVDNNAARVATRARCSAAA